MEELGEGDELRLWSLFGQSSVLSTYNKESVKISGDTDLESYLGPVWTFCSFFTRIVTKTVKTERRDAIFYLLLGVSDFLCKRVWWTCFQVFLSKRNSALRLKVLFFFSFKILDSKEQDVASSTVAQEGEDTQTMRVALEGEIPADGECI